MRDATAYDHGHYSIAQFNALLQVVFGDEIKALEEREVSQELGGRAQGDLEATHELRGGAKSIPLCDIGRYGRGGPADLVNETEVLADGRRHREQVCRPCELLGTAPSIEVLERPHRVTIRTGRATERTETAQPGAVCRTHPASRIPLPGSSASRISHLACRFVRKVIPRSRFRSDN